MAEMTARVVVIRGRVQGVCFRATCRRRSLEHGVAGWVRNEPDGSVRAWFEGPRDAVDAMVSWCHAGPGDATVEDVAVGSRAPLGLSGFGVA